MKDIALRYGGVAKFKWADGIFYAAGGQILSRFATAPLRMEP